MEVLTNQDYLVCGVCQTSFYLSDMALFINHKRFDCDNKENTRKTLQCSSCLHSFHSPWSLLKHVQNVHNLQIFFEELDLTNMEKSGQIAKKDNKALKNMIEEAVSSSILSLTTPSSDALNNGQDNNDQPSVDSQVGSMPAERESTKESDCQCCESNVVTTTAASPKSVIEEETDSNSESICLKPNCCCCRDKCECKMDTVMQKCCSSIVPKKRPRHFLKHLEERQQNEKQSMENNSIAVPSNEPTQLLSSTVDARMIDISSTSARKKKLNGNKAFMCEVCGEGFNQRIHLKKHMSKHTGIKPYKCNQCNYATVERSHLKVHNRIHTGEKPFKCTLCDYATAQNSTLKIHMKRHHSNVDKNTTSNENHQQQSITTSQDSDSLEDLLMLSASLLPS